MTCAPPPERGPISFIVDPAIHDGVLRRGRAAGRSSGVWQCAVLRAPQPAATQYLLAQEAELAPDAAIYQRITDTRDGAAQDGRIDLLVQDDALAGDALEVRLTCSRRSSSSGVAVVTSACACPR